ncbi:hypothetical protein [Sinomonas susongensis]|uniref:hypothetical protein n=1 Tax=Sinomonas susongensis TaxID=1324851 RepID=UPI001107F8A5|nr:hypothetical protein [Sinomonas susongensis]
MPEDAIGQASVYRPQKALPVWVEVSVVDSSLSPTTMPGFALAWTREHVLIQIKWPKEYFVGARNLWTEAKHVSRRVIAPSGPR